MTWTAERVERLTALWNDGYSATQIARDLRGVSRNAIIGKIYRLGLTGRGQPTQAPAKRTRRTEPRAVVRAAKPAFHWNSIEIPLEPLPTPHAPSPAPSGLSLADLPPHTCHWPYGDGPFTFCGAPADGVYCEYHADIAGAPYVPRQRRRVA